MSARTLTESTCARTARKTYFIDGRRVSNHDYSIEWLALNAAGRLPEQGDYQPRPGGWRTVYTVKP